MKLLIKLHKGYGLGDAVQFTIALQHLRKHRPDWSIDYVAERGRHSAAFGLCNRVFAYDEFDGSPFDDPLNYGRVITATMYDNASGHSDRPNTRVVDFLQYKFGIEWDHECGRYQVNVREPAWAWAKDYFESIGCHGSNNPNRWRAVAIHTHGDSAPERKNMTDAQAKRIADAVISAGRVPIILGSAASRIPPYDPPWGGDAEHLAALIGSCEAFVGIDSGPGKVTSATATPSLICWTRHHPVQFHDPAANTVHLVPEWHGRVAAAAGCGAAVESGFFERAYRHRTYMDSDHERGLAGLACEWLREVLMP